VHTIDVVGALHGELQLLIPLDALVPLDDLAGKLTRRGIPDPLRQVSHDKADTRVQLARMPLHLGRDTARLVLDPRLIGD
jgi:hypothetical protein